MTLFLNQKIMKSPSSVHKGKAMFNKTILLKTTLILMILSASSYLMLVVNSIDKDYDLFTQKIHLLVEYELLELEKDSFILDKKELSKLIAVISERDYDVGIHSTYFYLIHVVILINFIILILLSIYGLKYQAMKNQCKKK